MTNLQTLIRNAEVYVLEYTKSVAEILSVIFYRIEMCEISWFALINFYSESRRSESIKTRSTQSNRMKEQKKKKHVQKKSGRN